MSGQGRIRERIDRLDTDFEGIKDSVREIWKFVQSNSNTKFCNELAVIQKDQYQEFKNLKIEICDLKSKVDQLINKLSLCEKNLQVVKAETETKLKIELENIKAEAEKPKNIKIKKKNKPYGRNLVVHGVKKDNEKMSDLRWFEEFCSANLNVVPDIVSGSIKKAKAGHYVGVFTLKSTEEKGKVFRNCHKLKISGHRISIADDYYEECIHLSRRADQMREQRGGLGGEETKKLCLKDDGEKYKQSSKRQNMKVF